MTRPTLAMAEAIAHTLGDIRGLHLIDMGCGTGDCTRELAAMGAVMQGLDPNPKAIDAARLAAGGPDYLLAPAEATGLPDGVTDAVIFTNSLHHVPDMPAALAEAARLTGPGGRVLVIEPEAGDPSCTVCAPVDDETAVYRQAITAMRNARDLRPEQSIRFQTPWHVACVDDVIAGMRAADPTRTVTDAQRARMAKLFSEHVVDSPDGPFLWSWQRLDCFRVV